MDIASINPITIKNTPSIICDIDPEEKQFDQLVKLWVNNDITYDFLIENYPSYESSMLRRLVLLILKLVKT
jgi:hypothetical protein